MRCILAFFIIIGFTQSSYAKCNFLTSDYIDVLSKPKSISSIDIEVAKSSKYYQNAFSVITSRSQNIPEKLKKRFKANLRVNYKFGYCEYAARVRQNGDWKDHIRFKNTGDIVRSLDVRLDEGNVLNAVRFKLLLPETRNGINEVLASLILKKLGFISPETFEVEASVNGISTKMLFQENAEKELLERSFKREGPIFEGNESLLWSYGNYKNFELENLALSRMINSKWFKKGANSQQITLKSFARLQESYLKYAASVKNINGLGLAIFPNQIKNKTFVNYHYALIAMNGYHALRPHNRQYYYNAIESSFEPIYYDGDIMISSPMVWQEYFKILFPTKPDQQFLDQLSSISNDDELFEEFFQRVLIPSDNAKEFFLKSIEQFRNNQKVLLKVIIDIDKKIPQNIDHKYYLNEFIEFQRAKHVDQIIINDIKFDKKNFKAYSLSGNQYNFTPDEMVDFLGKNVVEDRRGVFIVPSESIKNQKSKTLNSKDLPGNIIVSNGMLVDINIKKKIINFSQTNSKNWALLSGGDFSDWHIFFNGVTPQNNSTENNSQRFNNSGLTGCLNIYKAKIFGTSFNINNGGCEDSINIISSKGEDISIYINNAFADAADLDFSDLAIKKLNVNGAGNDCFDVSGGKYFINKALLEKCKDKAISVGERSTLEVDHVEINKSTIGLVSKDMSILKVSNFLSNDVSSCGEAYQKKQEFGGAILVIQKSNCSIPIKLDLNSKFKDN